MIEQATIRRAAASLQRAAPGATVILFGSYARGDAREDSDLDFLVVVPELRARREEEARLDAVLRRLGVPADVLVTGRETFERWADTPNTVLYRAAREGRVLDALA